MIEKNNIAPTPQNRKDSLDAKIKKSLNSSIAYGLTTIGLLVIGLYLNSQSIIDQSQILQYTRSIIFALTMPFAIATTSSYLDYQSSRDFPSSSLPSDSQSPINIYKKGPRVEAEYVAKNSVTPNCKIEKSTAKQVGSRVNVNGKNI